MGSFDSLKNSVKQINKTVIVIIIIIFIPVSITEEMEARAVPITCPQNTTLKEVAQMQTQVSCYDTMTHCFSWACYNFQVTELFVMEIDIVKNQY